MMKKNQDRHLHFVGIGGIGMSGIAEVFLNQGYRISGSDLQESDVTRRLAQMGALIRVGHAAENVAGAQVVVVSSAVRPTNPEVIEARRLRIPIIPRAEMLGELMRGKVGIAVAGTHGKTTTTSMLASVLMAAGSDPTIVIGGKVDSLGSNAKLGHGQFVVAEADESDGSFLHLPATYGIVTNIDNDHLDHFGSLAKIEDAFAAFVGKLPFYGMAAVCGEDPGVKRCLARFMKPVVTYGFSLEWDFYASEVQATPDGSLFVVHGRAGHDQPHRKLGSVVLHKPGIHNVLNALGTIAVSMALDIPFDTIARGLAEFRGVKRRFELKWRSDDGRRLIVDDYGHHPTEVAATLAAARSSWKGRILAVFQPHRYSRTLHCHDGFLTAFHHADHVFLTDIYPAGEDPIPGISGESLAADIQRIAPPGQQVEYVGSLQSAQERVLDEFRGGDLVLCLGAGSITKLADQLAAVVRAEKVQ